MDKRAIIPNESEQAKTELMHVGVLGMRWGVRKASRVRKIGRRGARQAKNIEAKKQAREKTKSGIKKLVENYKEERWRRNALSSKTYMKMFNKAADNINANVIPKINNKKEYKDKNFTDPKNKKLYDKYLKEYQQECGKAYASAFTNIMGTNSPNNKYSATIVVPEPGAFPSVMIIKNDAIKHEASMEEPKEIRFILKTDKNGFIINVIPELESENLVQSDILQHVGILGMKWGIRKKASSIGSEDHRKASAIKKKSIKDMSNDELKTLTTRLQLEAQYSQLNPSKVSRGKKIFADIMLESGKKLATNAITNGVKNGSNILLKQLKLKNPELFPDWMFTDKKDD